MWCLPAPVVVWLALVLADILQPGQNLDAIMQGLNQILVTPFAFEITKRSFGFVAIALALYAMAVFCYETEKGRKRPGEEYGSAEWGNPAQLNAKYADRKHPEQNIILTENLRVGMDGHKHRRNLNVLVIGGSGSGKTRFYAKPNIMQADNCSFIVCDPKGEILRSLGGLLEAKGYRITIFDLIHMKGHFNPFVYLRSDADVLKLVNNLIKNTTPKGAQQNDPFWEKAEIALISALILFLKQAPEDEQNFATVMELLRSAEVKEDNDDYKSPLDMLFDTVAEQDPASVALKQYRVFKQAAGKTASSILVSAAVRLAAFNLPEIASITDYDEMDLGSLGEEKRAVFCIIPDNDDSFNYIVGMLYTSAFQELYHKADFEHGGRLPVHVRLIMDEFANVALPENFERLLATMRSREISVSIIIQNMAQLKGMFQKTWENITGNCDTMLYLGGNEQGTHEYITKLLGKATIDTKTRGLTKGRNGSSSENHQIAGRELLAADEVRKLDDAYALVFIRGEKPVMDKKYNILKHPNVKLTDDGGYRPYSPIEAENYEQPDLSFQFTSLEDIEFLD